MTAGDLYKTLNKKFGPLLRSDTLFISFDPKGQNEFYPHTEYQRDVTKCWNDAVSLFFYVLYLEKDPNENFDGSTFRWDVSGHLEDTHGNRTSQSDMKIASVLSLIRETYPIQKSIF